MTDTHTLEGELWTPIDFGSPLKHKELYISNFGRVKRIKLTTGKSALLKGSTDNRGRKILNVKLADGRFASRYVHHLVAEYFIDKPDPTYERIVHIDGNKINNHFSNLAWVDVDGWRENKNQRKSEA